MTAATATRRRRVRGGGAGKKPGNAIEASYLIGDIDTTKVDVGRLAPRVLEAQKRIPIDVARPIHHQRNAHECYVRVIVWDLFRDFLISGGGDGWIRIWSTEAPYKFESELEAELSVRSLLVLTQELASGHSNGEVIIWDMEKRNRPKKQTLAAHTEAVYAMCMLRTGELVTGAEDIRVFARSRASAEFRLVTTVAEEVLCMCSVPGGVAGTQVVTGNMNGLITVWDTADDEWQEAAQCPGHDRSVWSICYVRDAKRVASGSADNTLRIWNPDFWELERILTDHSGWIVGLSPGNGCLLSSSIDQTVRLWDTSRWKCARVFDDQEYEVYCACTFSGGRFATGGAEMSLVIYGDPFDGPAGTTGEDSGSAAKQERRLAQLDTSRSSPGTDIGGTPRSPKVAFAASVTPIPNVKKGDRVYRKGQPCTVVLVDYCTEPPHVVVRTEDGNEIGTELDRLEQEPSAGVLGSGRNCSGGGAGGSKARSPSPRDIRNKLLAASDLDMTMSGFRNQIHKHMGGKGNAVPEADVAKKFQGDNGEAQDWSGALRGSSSRTDNRTPCGNADEGDDMLAATRNVRRVDAPTRDRVPTFGETPQRPPFVVGQRAKVYSASQNRWLPCRVTLVEGGMVTVQYTVAAGPAQKCLPEDHEHLAHDDGPVAEVPRPEVPRPEYREGGGCMVFSATQNRWLPASVLSVDGSMVTVIYKFPDGGEGKKQLPEDHEHLRPLPPSQGSPSPFPSGGRSAHMQQEPGAAGKQRYGPDGTLLTEDASGYPSSCPKPAPPAQPPAQSRKHRYGPDGSLLPDDDDKALGAKAVGMQAWAASLFNKG